MLRGNLDPRENKSTIVRDKSFKPYNNGAN